MLSWNAAPPDFRRVRTALRLWTCADNINSRTYSEALNITTECNKRNQIKSSNLLEGGDVLLPIRSRILCLGTDHNIRTDILGLIPLVYEIVNQFRIFRVYPILWKKYRSAPSCNTYSFRSQHTQAVFVCAQFDIVLRRIPRSDPRLLRAFNMLRADICVDTLIVPSFLTPN